MSPKNLSHLMISVAAAVDIKGRLEHPEQSNLCNWSVDQKLTAGTFVTILALNLAETILLIKEKYEHTLQQGHIPPCKIVKTLICWKYQIDRTPNINL